jgi:hypothetical protein
MDGKRQFCQVGHDLIYARDLSRLEKLVCIILISFGQPAFPSMRLLSELTRSCDSIVRSAIKGLESKGYVRVDRGHKGKSNRYWVLKGRVARDGAIKPREPPHLNHSDSNSLLSLITKE